MLNINKWLAKLLALSLLFNLIPMNVLAEGSSGLSAEELQPTETAELISELPFEISSETTPEMTPEQPSGSTSTSDEAGKSQVAKVPASEIDNQDGNENGEEDSLAEDEEEVLVDAAITDYSEFSDEFAKQFASELITYGIADETSVKNIINESDSGITLNVGANAKILILLSHQVQSDEANYCDWTINFNTTGPLSLGTENQEVTVDVPDSTDKLIYQGLGDEGFPFEGKFTGNIGGFTSAYTIFKSVSAAIKLETNASGTPTIPITWDGTQDKPILANILVATGEERSVSMPLASSSTFSPYIGELSGDIGLVNLPSLNYSSAKSTYTGENPTTGNLGLVCNHMASNTKMQINELQLSNQVDLRGTDNVGGLVGQMDDGSTLGIGQTLNLNVKLEGESAGGLVGLINEGSIQFENEASVDISAELKATNSGGLVGQVNVGNTIFNNPDVILSSVKSNGSSNAGILYGMCTVTSDFNPFDGVIINDATTEVSGLQNCGGVFGTLTLDEDGKCTISGAGEAPLEISSTLSSATNNTQYGGIAGTLSGTARKNALIVDQCTITSTVDVGTDSKNYPKYLGGIVAVQGNSTTVDARNSTVTLSNPRTPSNTYGIGGLCTSVGNEALLIVDNMKVVIDSFVKDQGSSGVAGSTGKGAIVYLKKSLDLSECFLETCAYSGQIVGKQDCSLIYAPNVTITRLNTTSGTTSYSGVELDDIGNYGELYRIEGFLTLNNKTYETSLPELAKTDSTYNIDDETDYACLALAWQSRKEFDTISGEFNELKSETITIKLKNNIDLTGKGIGGLTRDYDKDSDNDKFSGTFNGNNCTITLDIGAKNKGNDVAKGDGRIYWHNATGLFAILSSNARVENLTLEGNIRLSNNKLTSAMHSGALAAQMKDSRNDESYVLSKVSTSVEYDAIVNGANPLYLGGLIGLITGANTSIDFDIGTSLAAIIDITHSGNGSFNHIGGAIGGISTDSAATITCNGASIGGGITSNVSSGTLYNFYAGGLIGTIFPSSNQTRSITINNLGVNNFALTSSASDRMSGILGGIWANADVAINGLTVDGTTLASSGTAAVGGLVYRASGKWTISEVNLSGLTINASNATALGLMVCHGEPYKEPINDASANKSIDGLYIEMTTDWDSGYQVPNSINFSGTVFDEFVAYTANRSTDTNYDITRNGSGIISLKTIGDEVNMTKGECNTYLNRTSVGVNKQTNKYSRYYYNLDVDKSGLDATVDTAQELLIWSVYRYAASNLKQYFTFDGVETRTIGTDPSGDVPADFDMKGLSYYPIDISNENITVQYADVKFYNDDIETKESENKSTRGTDREHTQHYMMHCALFHDFEAENISKTENYTMTVNGVSFAGSVGVVNSGSGALLCGTVAGKYDGNNTAICKVVLADEDKAEKAITLKGISVMPEDTYTPVLINTLDGYVTLEANYVTIDDEKQTDRAGSSLIGNVGFQQANKVTITFAGTIKLPEREGVFKKATLLNRLQYADGSATYTFNSDKDTNKHDTTHGKELTTSVEYEGKIGFYDDKEETKIEPKVEDVSDFSVYLPYVAFSPATKDNEHTLDRNWHELAVNIHSYNILQGCGTYGHPYIVTAKEFREAASFVNTGKASNNWQIRMPIDSAEYHSIEDENDVIVSYSSNDPDKAKKIQEHLRSAYYQLKADEGKKFELSNFNGIGSSPETAFKGVIYGNNLTVSLTGGSSAFIKYSYGSVVRDIKFDLQQNPTLTWKEPERVEDGNLTRAQQAPGTFFGGVIGCVLGGDNIIDNVAINAKSPFKLTLTGTNAYLVPVGGYVGVIAGGGVLFRGNCSKNGDLSTEYNDNLNDNSSNSTYHIYENPIIGRVLGGYAFYEGENIVPNNGVDANYKINNIFPNKRDLVWDGSTLTVNNAEGLLILSAIVSSGAGSENSNAYKLGVARKAKYDKIGEATQPDDYAVAKSEDSISYLNNYVSGEGDIRKLCTSGTEGITINFAQDGNFNMSIEDNNYGNGYRGLSARYVSNAAFNGSNVEPYMVVLRVKTFDGNNNTVTGINMDVKEYTNDDFHIASMGGIFNIVWTKKNGGGTDGSTFAKDLTLENSTISLQYFDDKKVEQKQANTTTFVDNDGLSAVTVGGFIGSICDDGSPVKTSDNKGNYLLNNIHIKGSSNDLKSKITGPNSAGGLIGASAMTSTALTGCPGVLLSNHVNARFGPNFLNCSYSYVDITGKLAAGGLIGVAYAYESTDVQFGSMGCSYSSNNYCFASCTVTEETFKVGENSVISATSQHGVSAGLFGIVGMRSGVNDPEVNGKTGLTIASEDSMKAVSLSNVQVTSSTTNDIIYRSDGTTVNGPDKSSANTAAGGIIGRISHVNESKVFDIKMKKCSANANTWATNAYAAGIVAYGYTNTKMVISSCELTEFSVNGKYAGGLVGYGYGGGGYNLHVSDCEISESTINGNSYSGGLVGKAAGKYYITNILIKNTSITGHSTNRGRLFGEMYDSTNTFYVRAAGVSVIVNKDGINIPSRDGNVSTYNGYIAYADYGGIDNSVINENSPYVTVNPNFTLTGANKMLTGDAVKIDRTDTDNVIPIASRIWEDQKSSVTDANKLNRVPYQNVSNEIKAKDLPEVSTFYAVQNCGPKDLPVLTIKGGDTSVIEDYLNVITNGGYGKAKNITKIATNEEDKVLELSVSVYAYENDIFVKKSKEDLTNAKALASIYVDSGELKVLGNSYDNTRNRFSLVEAKFKVTVDGELRTYTVSVPVVVIRELQYDFMATFTYGAEFRADTFNLLDKHVLENTGNPFTGYLSYVYNREQGSFVPYEWQSYMDSGGDMLNVDKVLKFINGLPKDTQMVLIDCQDGNRAYQYKAGDTINKVKLSDFTSVSDGTNFRSSMADVLGVIKSGPNETGKYVKITNVDEAKVQLNGEYYRLYADSDGNVERYDLTIPDLSKEKNKPVENYYLMITVPDQNNQNYFLNGNLTSQLDWSMPNSGTQVHRYSPTTVDKGDNTESSYQIYAGYQQSLESLSVGGEAINLMNADNKMQVKLKDTITFSSKQAYDKNDPLFAKFNVSLKKHMKDSVDIEELQFCAGTSGKVHFYIQDSNNRYYFFDGSTWKIVTNKTEATAYNSYEWISKGSNMELILSNDGIEALDLAWVRQTIIDEDTLDSKIIITAEMDIDFSGQEVLNEIVPASDQNGADVWAQLHYTALLSTQASSLNYTANRTAVDDNAHYYRGVQYQAILALDAAKIDQLGVNPLELVASYMKNIDNRDASQIELNAALNLTNLPDYESILQETKEIEFRLSLEQRSDNGYKTVENASDYIAFAWLDGSTEWNWTISQDQFYVDGKLVTSDLYRDAQFTFPLKAFVFIDQTEFANYKIKLSVSFLDANQNPITVALDDKDAHVVYTYACIKPSFYEPTQEGQVQ